MHQRGLNSTALDLGLLTDQLTTGLQRLLRKELGSELDGIGPRHRAVLANLEPTGSRASELAARCGQHKQVIGTLVDDLENLGYLCREPDPADRRAKRIIPTDLGLRQTSKITDAMTRIEHRLANDLGDDSYRRFRRSFEQVTDILSATADSHDPSQ